MLKLVTAALFAGVMVSNGLALQGERDDYVSKASHIIGTYEPSSTEHTPKAMAEAAQNFLDALDTKLRDLAVHELDSPERKKWTNLPARPDAGGVQLGKLNEKQLKACCDLMATLFSKQGYRKMCNIMLADDQLLPGGRARPGFGTETFSVVVFGTPSETKPWAFQLDGHHVGVNVAVKGDALTMSPSFIGTQPEAFLLASKKIRPLAKEIDEAHEFVNNLSEQQRKSAVVGRRRGRIQTGPGRDGTVPEPRGLSCESLDDDQRKALLSLISQWVNDMPADHAERRMKQIESELDKTHFSWNGPIKPGSDVSYTIQGPSLIIEYACQDLGGVPTNHLHTMYRNPKNEYGGQLNDQRSEDTQQ